MAQSASFTITAPVHAHGDRYMKPITKIAIAWVADGSGNVDVTSTQKVSGLIARCVTVPDSGGTQPDNLYDVVINDDNGVDVLVGGGTDRNETNAEQFAPLLSTYASVIVADTTLTIVVSNAGADNAGTLNLYMI